MQWWARRFARKGEVEEQKEEQELGKCAAYSIGCRECGVKGKAARNVKKRWKPSGNRTTTNRRSTKTSTTFCVFLLTENFLPLILRIQIRGDVEAPDGPSRGWTKVRVGQTTRQPGF